MRLIDADNMKKFVDVLYNCDGRADIIKRIIDQQPTAFDKDVAKGYIVMDIPKTCAECPFAYRVTEDFFTQKGIGYKTYWVCIGRSSRVQEDSNYKILLDGIKPKWCPIKEKPQRAYHENHCDNGRYDKGWNDLIDEMFGGF